MQIAYFIGTPKFPFSWSSLYASYLYLFLATPHHLSAALVPPSVSASINIHCMAGEPVHTLPVAAASLHFIPASFDLRRTAILFDLLLHSSSPCRCLPHLGIFLCICHFAWVVKHAVGQFL